MQIHEEQKMKNKLKEILNIKFLLGICKGDCLNNNVEYGVIFNENKEELIKKFQELNVNLKTKYIIPVANATIILEDDIVNKKVCSFVTFSNIIKELFNECTGKYEIKYPMDLKSELIKDNLIIIEEVNDLN